MLGDYVDAGNEPWSAVGMVKTYNCAGGHPNCGHLRGTGTVIGPVGRTVITAAHLFFHNGGWRSNLPNNGEIAFFGAYGAYGTDQTPLGKIFATNIYMPGQWFDHEQYYRDYALLALTSYPGGGSWCAAARSYNELLYENPARMAAYPDTKNDGKTLWVDNDDIVRVFTMSIRHTCSSWNGSSGAAVFHYSDCVDGIDDFPECIAVNKGNPWSPEDYDYNVGVRLTGDRIGIINDFIEDF